MINCKKYTQYLHKSELISLSWYEKILMNYHHTICKWCRKYTNENKWLNEYLYQHIEQHLHLSDEEIEQQKQALLKKLNL